MNLIGCTLGICVNKFRKKKRMANTGKFADKLENLKIK